MLWLVKVFESGTAMPHTVEFLVNGTNHEDAQQIAVCAADAWGYSADDLVLEVVE